MKRQGYLGNTIMLGTGGGQQEKRNMRSADLLKDDIGLNLQELSKRLGQDILPISPS